jgi:hypothetical protein
MHVKDPACEYKQDFNLVEEIPLPEKLEKLEDEYKLETVEQIYEELSSCAKNDKLFLSLFWSSYGFEDRSNQYLQEYTKEYFIAKEYNERMHQEKIRQKYNQVDNEREKSN